MYFLLYATKSKQLKSPVLIFRYIHKPILKRSQFKNIQILTLLKGAIKRRTTPFLILSNKTFKMPLFIEN